MNTKQEIQQLNHDADLIRDVREELEIELAERSDEMNSIEAMKKDADILIQYANGGSFTIKNQKNVDLGSARGIRRVYGNGSVEVTERKLTELQGRYNVASDF